jgi:hypothetical protein
VGVADLDQIAGKPFDREAFAEIPMLIVHGAADTNSSLPTTDEPSDRYSNAHARLVFEHDEKVSRQRASRRTLQLLIQLLCPALRS